MKKSRKSSFVAEMVALESRQLLSTVIAPASVSVLETNTTTKDNFTISLKAASPTATKVSIATKDGTAKAGIDYVATKKTVTIPAGKTSATFAVPVKGNITYDGNRKFTINYSSSTDGAKLVRKSTVVTIVDDEKIPTVTINDVVQNEGNHGKTTVLVTATLSGPSSFPITVNYRTANDTAIAGKDYLAQAGQFKFAKKQTSTTVKFTVLGNTIPEPDKVFDINFTGSTHSVLPSFSRVVIKDDDNGIVRVPTNINGSTVSAGAPANFIVSLTSASSTKVSIRYKTVANGTATSADFRPANGVVTFNPGQMQQNVSIATLTDPGATGTRTFDLDLSAPANATLANDHATGIIVEPSSSNNNGGAGANQLVTLSVSNPAAPESSAGQQFTLDYEIDLDGPSTLPVTVHYTTVSDDTDPENATAGVDYTAISGDLTFEPNVTKLIVSVPILASGVPHGTVKHVLLDLSNSTNATIADSEGIGAIIGTA